MSGYQNRPVIHFWVVTHQLKPLCYCTLKKINRLLADIHIQTLQAIFLFLTKNIDGIIPPTLRKGSVLNWNQSCNLNLILSSDTVYLNNCTYTLCNINVLKCHLSVLKGAVCNIDNLQLKWVG